MKAELGPQLLVGHVHHARSRPAVHAFQYPIFNIRIPIDALATVDPVLPVNRSGVVSFFSKDHGYRNADRTMEQWAQEQLRTVGIEEPLRIELVCLPRVMGHVFNPVSFWLCWRQPGELRALIAEVNNTFGERLSYVLTSASQAYIRNGETLRATKQLHVSPFNEVRGGYEFRVFIEADRLLVRIDYDDDNFSGKPLLTTHISGHCQPLTRSNVRRAALSMPLITLQVVAKIHWQALKLLAKRVPFFGYLPSQGKR